MKYSGISSVLNGLRDIREEKISLKKILDSDPASPYFTLFLMGLLSLIPTPAPIPIISNFFGILCCIVMFKIILGRKTAVLPKFLNKIFLKKQTLNKIIVKIGPFFSKIEKITRCRLNFLSSGSMPFVVNLSLLVVSIAMVMPVPLLSVVPSIAMIITTFGLLNNDGLLVMIGLAVGILSLPLIVKALGYALKFIRPMF
ncbi:MAG: exopolysaccharide biosynthesis protein [Rickettsiales bacterium]|jgi:hypothetical protein|nr:exopolysaccharide biosynthesis protein [Rickettsiales bacterium]